MVAAPLSASKPGHHRRKPNVPKWVVAGVVSTYCAGLAAGLLIYRRISTVPVQGQATSALKEQQVGRIFIISPNGCQSGEFNNSRPAYSLSQTSCNEALGKLEPGASAAQSGGARIRAIGRYFREAK